MIHTVKGFGVVNKAEAGNKISGRNINNFRYIDDTTLMAQSEEELKRLLMKVKEEKVKVFQKLFFSKKRKVKKLV